MDIRTANIFCDGGAGTLGRAIARRRKKEGWTGHLTVYSRDEHKHSFMRRLYPDVHYVTGDIRNIETLKLAMAGHDVVIHAGATKVIPVSEYYSMDTIDNNVFGSMNVCLAAREVGVKDVIGISTDKAAHPVNAYGATKYLMEKIFVEFARDDPTVNYHLTRYGNILESTGSVIEAWKKSIAAGEPIKITDPEMTRFWLSPQQAVTLVTMALKLESGTILIPKAPALSIENLAQYTLGNEFEYELIPMRPGEKIHEELLTIEETEYATESQDFFFLRPTTSPKVDVPCKPYSSDMAPELTREQLAELLEDR